ncbi:efflux RND transporter periplasmic adaptor subunit [Tardiphaga sp.]|uniref:efflux RND transporter periplasmic adaptor subunit n=1 Tax=Tardiphaga sp. TaxID=1926292 RepID=UPI0037D9B535
MPAFAFRYSTSPAFVRDRHLPARRVCLAIALLTLPAMVAGCGPRNSYQAPPPPEVKVQAPVQRDVTEYMEFTGQLVPVKSVGVVARIQGFLESIGYEDGTTVRQGQTLFTIEPAPYRAKLEEAEANLAASQAKALFATQQNERYATLASREVASQMQAQQSTADLNAAKASTQQAKAALDQARINYSYTKVTAPFDGVMTNHLQSVGALVGTEQTAQLATLLQINPIWAKFTVNEGDAIRVRGLVAAAGKTEADLRTLPVDVAMQGEHGFPHRGQLDYAAPAVDPATGTLSVRAILQNADRALLPGAFVKVRIPARKSKNALLVPDTALGNIQGTPTLLVVDADNKVEQRMVETGGREGELRIIRSGIAAGDRVIVTNAQQVAVGQTVAPHDSAAPAIPATPDSKP